MPGQTDTRAIMNDAFDAIAYLLPLSLLEMQGKANRDQELVARKLDVLERAASTLATHGGAHDTEFTLLSRAFDRAIPSVRRAFDERYPAFAWYALMSLTQHCSACHSRLPDERDYGFGQRLLARMDMDALEAAERARLLVATRQFERALGEYERALLDPGHRPEDADLDGLYVDYLNLSITVAQDFERPRVLLRRPGRAAAATLGGSDRKIRAKTPSCLAGGRCGVNPRRARRRRPGRAPPQSRRGCGPRTSRGTWPCPPHRGRGRAPRRGPGTSPRRC